MINEDDKMNEVELKNEPGDHSKTKMSFYERCKEESRNKCEVKNFQSVDMQLGSKIKESRKFESRAGKLIRIFEQGRNKTDIALNKHRMGHNKTEPLD